MDNKKFPNENLEHDAELISIYDAFIAKTTLEDTDREKLKKDRGFDDDVINILKFRSACPANAAIIKELEGLFSKEALLRSGLLEMDEHGNVKPSYQLLRGPNEDHPTNVIIPYLNGKGSTYFIRPHKLGLKDIPIQIYAPVRPLEDTIVITESEFKAVAAIKFGYKAIGLPGIHSFAVNNFPRLVGFLKQFPDIRHICIIFDNEVKDNPDFSNYKMDSTKRWDTPWRAIQMGSMLFEEFKNIRVTIGTLPDVWMINGKIDIDGALAQKRTKEEFKDVIENSYIPEVYMNKIPSEEGKKHVTRKYVIFKKRQNSEYKVTKSGNKYWIMKTVKAKNEGDPTQIPEHISDFTFRIVKSLGEGENLVRELVFTDEFGNESDPVSYKPDEIRSFNTWVLNKGHYHFTGEPSHIPHIFSLEDDNTDGRILKCPKEIGLLKREGLYLFGNCILKDDGKFFLPDEKSIIWDGTNGYCPRSIKEDFDEDNGKMPVINIWDGLKPKNLEVDYSKLHHPNLKTNIPFGIPELKSVIDDMCDNFNNKSVRLGVGWVIACLLSKEIFNSMGCFPILFIGGKRESGKTTLAGWLMSMMGFSEIAGDALSTTTRPGMARKLAWNSSLGYWLDEYRNDKKTKQMEGYFRNIYGRQETSKGTLGATVRSEEVNAGVILSGEETPEDNALLGRCVVINLVKAPRKPDLFKKLEDMRNNGLLSRLAFEVVTKKKKLLEPILTDINWLVKRLQDKKVGDRVAINYAIPTVCFNEVFNRDNIEAAKELISWVEKETIRVDSEKDKEHMLNVFLDDLITYQDKLRDFFTVYQDASAEKGKKRMAFHFGTFYTNWVEGYRKKGSEQFQAKTMLDYLKEEPYFLAHDIQRRLGPNNKNTKCTLISLDPEDRPHPSFLTLADGNAVIPDNDPNTDASTPSTPF